MHSFTWTKLQTGDDESESIHIQGPQASLFHGAAVCGGRLYVSGGGAANSERWGEAGSSDNPMSLVVYDMTMAWSREEYQDEPSAPPPRSRYGHGTVATAEPKQLFVFGGTYGNIDNTHPNGGVDSENRMTPDMYVDENGGDPMMSFPDYPK